MKDKEYHVANFATFVSKTLIFSPHNMDEFNFKRAEYCINKIIELTKPLFGRFQNGCNKVVIEPLVVQFWSEIILVISNRTRAARSFDFEITRMISAQIALHSVQLPLLIGLHLVLYHYKSRASFDLFTVHFEVARSKGV